MTVQEAIKKNISECKRRIFRIKDFLENDKGANIDKCKDNIFVLETTIQALEEIEQYRALGTVEELKEAREKQVAKKPIETEHFNCLNYECPICEGGLYHEQQYCDECGQAEIHLTEKPKTNADRIRNMTDEELYKFLRYFGVCRICKHRKDEGCDNRGCTQEEVDSFLKEWLQAEAKEGAEDECN